MQVRDGRNRLGRQQPEAAVDVGEKGDPRPAARRVALQSADSRSAGAPGAQGRAGQHAERWV